MKDRILDILNEWVQPYSSNLSEDKVYAAQEIAQLMCDREAKMLYDGFECFHNKSVADQCLHFFPASLYKAGYSMNQIEKAIEKLK